jgi:glutaconate CoA-transferase subunit A
MPDKRCTEDDLVAELRDGMTIGIGGWGSRRKPMALVRAVIRAGVRDLTIVSYGGPDVGLLCRTGQVRKLVYSFVSLESTRDHTVVAGLEPHFRAARQAGAIEALELDEGMFLLGLQAAAWRVPFLPTRCGLGSDVLERDQGLRTVRSPYDDGEELVAVPALHLDLALVHLHRGDPGGNGRYLSVDPYFDDLFCMAAARRFMSVERIEPTDDLLAGGPPQTLLINRLMTDGVIEAPGGAHFTECPPDYGRDEAFQQEYAATAKDDAAWDAFRQRYLDCESHAEYRTAVGLT